MKKVITIILSVLITATSLPMYAFADDIFETVETTDLVSAPVAYATSSTGGQWVQESNGRWWYKHSDGSYTKYNWEYIQW